MKLSLFTDVTRVYVENTNNQLKCHWKLYERSNRKAKDKAKQLFFHWININQYKNVVKNDTNQNWWVQRQQ